jgi:hypothetical protein
MVTQNYVGNLKFCFPCNVTRREVAGRKEGEIGLRCPECGNTVYVQEILKESSRNSGFLKASVTFSPWKIAEHYWSA